MFKFKTKKIEVPLDNETVEVDTVVLTFVSWYSRKGKYSDDTKVEVEAFPNESDATCFADSLRAAFKLLRHTSKTDVKVSKGTYPKRGDDV